MTDRKPKTMSEYQDMRRKAPRQYYSTKVQNEMLKDRVDLGDKFYGQPASAASDELSLEDLQRLHALLTKEKAND